MGTRLKYLTYVTCAQLPLSTRSKHNLFAFQRNSFIIERAGCFDYDRNLIKNLTCTYKALSQYTYNFDVHGFLPQPVDLIHLNIRLYYQYNTYVKIADVWDDACKSLSTKQSSPTMKAIELLVSKNTHTNFFNGCPYSKEMYFQVRNLSTYDLEGASLFPAGRYLAEVIVTQGLRKKSLLYVKIYAQALDSIVQE